MLRFAAMQKVLNEVEVRVLGSLVEKQITTPEYYPLTLNALTNACNQKSNRDPAVSYNEAAVTEAIESLREKNLVYVFYGSTSRVPKYKHMMPEVLRIDEREVALLCVLMLRGPQTVGELKERAGRLAEFASLGEVEEALSSLGSKETEPLVVKLPRRPGQKEARYAHLLAGEVSIDYSVEEGSSESKPASNRSAGGKLEKLEGEVEALKAEVTELRQRLEDFIKQFDS
ncbi:MAG TPA: YceH family protein [Pyrinomonadaceae bacterium]|nr:YceH family protein [Pyrinomonadaceae bacterium]